MKRASGGFFFCAQNAHFLASVLFVDRRFFVIEHNIFARTLVTLGQETGGADLC